MSVQLIRYNAHSARGAVARAQTFAEDGMQLVSITGSIVSYISRVESEMSVRDRQAVNKAILDVAEASLVTTGAAGALPVATAEPIRMGVAQQE